MVHVERCMGSIVSACNLKNACIMHLNHSATEKPHGNAVQLPRLCFDPVCFIPPEMESASSLAVIPHRDRAG
jgi:hypothetical protein